MALETPGCPAANALPPLASRFLKVDELPWKPTQVEGIDMKVLIDVYKRQPLYAQVREVSGKMAVLATLRDYTHGTVSYTHLSVPRAGACPWNGRTAGPRCPRWPG